MPVVRTDGRAGYTNIYKVVIFQPSSFKNNELIQEMKIAGYLETAT